MASFVGARLAHRPFIPLHVLEEILFRVDTQTLYQCIFICRDWNTLITSPDFILRSSKRNFHSKNQILFLQACHCQKSDAHYPYCPSPTTYSLHWDNDQFDLFRTLERPPVDDFKGLKVADVSNGLVCLTNKLPFKLILWNPTIQLYVWLPLPMTWEAKLSRIGFGFDRSSNNFKVVNIVHRHLKRHIEFDSTWIFSYATWSWKHLTCSFSSSWYINGMPHVFFNGVLHWIAWQRREDYSPDYNFILTFDLTREVFGQILFPKDLVDIGLISIVTTGDSLLLINELHIDDGEDDDEIDEDELVSNFISIWCMKQYGNHESWINISSTTTKIDPDWILGARRNGDLILDMRGEIHRYNPITPIYVRAGALENGILVRYHTESLYLLEKEKDVNSY